ncbi:S9 family peptidase [Paenibacillus taiwanensis]|uniref:S9 family peptidase n=1 Tax=Paenibacillus taiwanensis TaxID=401638 RepID=UPI000424C3E6|nr:S9 family peptidase [Paenibacillus taiwanensis]
MKNARLKLISATLAAVMAVSAPAAAIAANGQAQGAVWYKAGVDALVTKGILDKGTALTTTVTVQDFVRYVVQSQTYQHGTDTMKVALANGWVKDGEWSQTSVALKRGEMARILVRVLGKEQGEQSLTDYADRAKKLGLITGYQDGSLQEDRQVTVREAAAALGNLGKLRIAGIGNQGVPQISVEDFMRSPGNFAYQMSPDGDYISYVAPWESRANVYVKKMDGSSEPVRVTSSKDRDIAGFFWKGDHILYLKDKGGDENFHLYAAAFNGNEERDLTPYDKVRVGLVSSLSSVKDEILITMNKEDAKVSDVYKLNVKTGDTKLVAKNPGAIQHWLADREGKIRLALTTDGVVSSLLYRDNEEQQFRTLISLKAGDSISPVAFSADGKSIYAASNQGRDKVALVKLDLNGKEQVLYEHPEVDISNALYDAKTDKIQAVTYVTDKAHIKFYDDKLEALYSKLEGKLGASRGEISINDYNKEMTKLIVTLSNDKTFGRYYYYDAASDQMTQLANLSDWLKPDQLSDMQPISFKSRDGLTIHGYLTLPKNKKPENLPLIVNPHGGPWMRDMWGFNPEVQLLANRGYAVLQVNFRSSIGYGKAFVDAGDKQWGLNIQNDITDGVQWAIKQGIADKKRVGIYGASFGGYATLAGITFTPDLYAAAVDYVGVSNIFTLLETLPPYWESLRNMFYTRVGDPVKDKELLKSVSPVFHADKIVTPLFVAQGANDPRVNKAESDQIVAALKKRGVVVEYMVKDNEGHGFNNEENKIEFYNAMIKFLDKHLKK